MVMVVCRTILNVQSLKLLPFRFLVNFSITFGFFGFWHVALYLLHWSDRPFQPGRSYRVGKVAEFSTSDHRFAINIIAP